MVGKIEEISVGDSCGEVAVKANGVRVEVHANGSVDVYTDRPLVLHGAANGNDGLQAQRAPVIGNKMADGTVYAGISPDTGKALYASPKDAPLTYTFNAARRYAAALDAHGHRDWRVPTKDELNVMFNNRAAIEGFDTSGSFFNSWYWSSSKNILNKWAQRFSDGLQDTSSKYYPASLRVVRG